MPKQTATIAPRVRRMLGPKDLPAKGITYHMNHLRRLIQAGDFPKPVRLSAHRIAWTEDAIDAWLDKKIRASG